MSRPSTPRSLEKKLKREVNNYCPICGGFPLVSAHTIKPYKEAKFDYDLMLAICIECEKKVEDEEIERRYLDEIKKQLKTSISLKERNKPYAIPKFIPSTIKLGNNIFTGKNIFVYKGLPILWLEKDNGFETLNARFYDEKGSVVSAIDRNFWTADRDRFYDVEVLSISDYKLIKMIGKKNDTFVQLKVFEDKVEIIESVFYLPGQKIIIKANGNLSFRGFEFKNSQFGNDTLVNFE